MRSYGALGALLVLFVSIVLLLGSNQKRVRASGMFGCQKRVYLVRLEPKSGIPGTFGVVLGVKNGYTWYVWSRKRVHLVRVDVKNGYTWYAWSQNQVYTWYVWMPKNGYSLGRIESNTHTTHELPRDWPKNTSTFVFGKMMTRATSTTSSTWGASTAVGSDLYPMYELTTCP